MLRGKWKIRIIAMINWTCEELTFHLSLGVLKRMNGKFLFVCCQSCSFNEEETRNINYSFCERNCNTALQLRYSNNSQLLYLVHCCFYYCYYWLALDFLNTIITWSSQLCIPFIIIAIITATIDIKNDYLTVIN